jgi:UDP-2,3-diacylglucosamine pyrophosphatase LpxH
MNFDYGSDLHISFDKDIDKLIDRFPNNRSDTLILAGDIIEVSILKGKSNHIKKNAQKFLKWVSEHYRMTYYVFGNHEFYDAEINFAVKNFRDILGKMGIRNIRVLDNEVVEHENTVILGATMWTNCNNENPLTIHAVQSGMNDYRYINYFDTVTREKRSLCVGDTLVLNSRFKTKLRQFMELETGRSKIVVTHHCPSIRSIDPCYKTATLSYAYFDELFDTLHDSDIQFWIHGHTHDPSDYTINKTRILANPRGYVGYETLANDWLIKTFQV